MSSKISGIYRITNLNNGKYYIGSSNDCKSRWRGHRRALKNNRHDNPYLQNAWNKYGESAFKFEVIDQVPIDLLVSFEQFYLDFISLEKDMMYNINPYANGLAFGDKNTNYDPTIYSFINRNTMERFTGTQLEFKQKYDVDDKRLPVILNPKPRKDTGHMAESFHGWMTLNNYNKWRYEKDLQNNLRVLKDIVEYKRSLLKEEEEQAEREKDAEAKRLYFEAHKEEIIKERNAKQLQYYYDHKEERKEYTKQYWKGRYAKLSDEQKAKKRAITRRWKQTHKEYVKQRQREYMKTYKNG